MCVYWSFPANNMPAFRQVGEKQLPNPVLCMAWSPKRDLIALANTTGEVGSFIYPETCLGIFYCCVIVWLVFVRSYCYTAWLVSSVFGAYHPVTILGRRSLHWHGDLMAKVRSDCVHIFVISHCLLFGHLSFYTPVFIPQYWPSVWQTLSRWFCVVLRKPRSSMCFRCRTLWPACTGWRWRRRAGMHEAEGSNQWHRGRVIYLQIKNVSVCSFSYVLVPSALSATRRMNPNFSFPNYQLSPRGNVSIRCTDEMRLTPGLNHIVSNCCFFPQL